MTGTHSPPTTHDCGLLRRLSVTRYFVFVMCTLAGLGASSSSLGQVQRFSFLGGPDNSTLQFFAEGLSTLLSRSIEGAEMAYTASAGAIENLDRIGNGSADFSIVYSADLYRHIYQHGQGAASPHRNVQPVSSLFGVKAHLMVPTDSDITTAAQLSGRRVAVGSPGSVSAAAAQDFFESLEIWHQMNPQFMTPEQGTSALDEGRVDALWVFAAVPSTVVIHATSGNRVRMLNLTSATQSDTLKRDHPYYTPTTIPAGIYPGVDYDIGTIQEAALWVAGGHVPEDVVYKAINEAYSVAGLSFMHTITHAAGAMSIADALKGVLTPMHPGARKYWSEQGMLPNEAQQ